MEISNEVSTPALSSPRSRRCSVVGWGGTDCRTRYAERSWRTGVGVNVRPSVRDAALLSNTAEQARVIPEAGVEAGLRFALP